MHDHHDHDHNHGHHGHHHHDIQLSSVNRAFIVGIVLNMVFIVIEVVAGIYYQSLSLLSDAGHNLSDVASLLIALLAFKLSTAQPTSTYTYGYRKTTVLAALLNAFILLIAVGIIGGESVHRLVVHSHTHTVSGGGTAVVAGIGILINALTALLFLRDKEKDINIKGAYLHMAADALVSLGVVISGIIIMFTEWFWVDAVVSLLIALVILLSTWNLLKDSIRLSLDGVPKKVNIDKIKAQVIKLDLVLNIHHIHVWAISTTQNAFTAHLVLAKEATFEQSAAIRKEVRHILTHENVQHATIEIEKEEEDCSEEHCGESL